MESFGGLVLNLVLDTNALWNGPLVRGLARAREEGLQRFGELEVVLPAIAFAERARQLAQDDDSMRLFRQLLGDIGAKIEPFGVQEGERLASRKPPRTVWRAHARDLLIAAHVHRDRVAVTGDRGPGWQEVGTLTPPQAVRAVQALIGS